MSTFAKSVKDKHQREGDENWVHGTFNYIK